MIFYCNIKHYLVLVAQAPNGKVAFDEMETSTKTITTLLFCTSFGLDFTDVTVLLCSEQLMQLYCARQRRRLNRGLRRKQQSLLKRLRKAKKEAPPMEKPEVVKTHLRDMVILPEMVGSMVGVYNGKTFNQVEIKVSCYWSVLGLSCII